MTHFTRLFTAALLSALISAPASAADDLPELLKTLRAVGPEGKGSAAARSAWEKVAARGPDALPQILEALDTADPVVRNWLRTAFDAVADRALAGDRAAVPRGPVLAFAGDEKRNGAARRLALDLLERLEPGTTVKFIADRLDDPEFRFEAIVVRIAQADKAAGEPAAALLRQALEAARDLDQIKAIAARLKKHGVETDLPARLGFFSEWYVIGPFDARGGKGFAAVYPPEEKVDLSAEHDGKSGKVRWKRVKVPEPQQRTGLLSIRSATGDADDAVAYAFTAFELPAAVAVEFRAAGDDNISVWVNGKREFAFEEYRNGVRLDRHRFQVKLNAGRNTVLVKVCQAPLEPSHPEPNWEFFLRMTDATGKGIAGKSALP